MTSLPLHGVDNPQLVWFQKVAASQEDTPALSPWVQPCAAPPAPRGTRISKLGAPNHLWSTKQMAWGLQTPSLGQVLGKPRAFPFILQVILHSSSCFWSWVLFLPVQSCPAVHRPHEEGYASVRTQICGSDSSSLAARCDAMHMQIAMVSSASTCWCRNECAPCSLQPGCALSSINSFVLCCFSAVMEFGARRGTWGAPAQGGDALSCGCALEGSKGIIAQDLFQRKGL